MDPSGSRTLGLDALADRSADGVLEAQSRWAAARPRSPSRAGFRRQQFSRTVSRVDPRTSRVVGTKAGGEATALAAGRRPGADGRRPELDRASRRDAQAGDAGASRRSTRPSILRGRRQFGRLAYDRLVSFQGAPGPAGLRLVPDLAVACAAAGRRDYAFRLRRGTGTPTGGPLRRRLPPRDRAPVPRRLVGRELFAGIVGADRCRRRSCPLSRGIVTDERRQRHLPPARAGPGLPLQADRLRLRRAGPARHPRPRRRRGPVPGPGRTASRLDGGGPSTATRASASGRTPRSRRQPRRDRLARRAASTGRAGGRGAAPTGSRPPPAGTRRHSRSRIPPRCTRTRRSCSSSSRSTRTLRRSTTCACGARSTRDRPREDGRYVLWGRVRNAAVPGPDRRGLPGYRPVSARTPAHQPREG